MTKKTMQTSTPKVIPQINPIADGVSIHATFSSSGNICKMKKGCVNIDLNLSDNFPDLYHLYTMAEMTSIKGSFLALGARSQSWKLNNS